MNKLNLLFLSSLFFISSHSQPPQDDFRCLQGFKNNLTDPQQNLISWNFTNPSPSFICNSVGITCSNDTGNPLIGLQLPSMDLSGTIPEALQFCRSLQALDLSNNSLSGLVPSRICSWFPFLLYLDLSRNNLFGPIPPEFGNCKYLINLNLEHNQLSGTIPYQLDRLHRLERFSVAYNNLSGQIPVFLSGFSPTSFVGNSGLYGVPLGPMFVVKKRRNAKIIVAAAISGAAFSLLLSFVAFWFCKGKKRAGTRKDDSDNWVKRLSPHGLVEVSLFNEPIVKIKLSDLLVASNNFDPENIIISTRTGTLYKAVLRDGSALAIKRLHTCELNEKQFQAEMSILEELRHPNLVPLLGFCVVEDEKLLVYKHMPNGSLGSLLHGSRDVETGHLDWPARLKIGIGIARGLAWLHHGCEQPFMHQNISSNAILLDEDFDARIVDFGLVKLLSLGDSHKITFIYGAFGEFGYVAPEYSSTMVATLKGDVYGVGVVLLELVTGRKPLDLGYPEEEFKQLSSSGRIKDAIGKSLLGNGYDDEILQFLMVACRCVVSKPQDRPSMDQIYYSLKAIGEGHDFSKEFDEFPLSFSKQEHDHNS